MDRGILIAVEGIDGAGKTTQLELLASFLADCNEQVVRSKEPTNGIWGQRIRESASAGRMNLKDELHAFIEDRKEHVRNLIEPSLGDGKIVLLDRYFFSTIAYQGSRGGNIAEITALVRKFAPEPDAVIILDVSADVGVTRVRKRDVQENKFEDVDNLRSVRAAFLQIAQANQLEVIDGSPEVNLVHREIVKSLLQGVLRNRRCAQPMGCENPPTCEYRQTDSCKWARMADKQNQLP